MKKRNVFFVLLFLLALGGVFRHALLGRLITYTANHYTQAHFGAPLVCEGISKEGDAWMIKSLHIEREDVCLTAKTLAVTFDWHPFDGYMAIEMLVDESEITIDEKSAKLSSLLSDILPKRLPLWMINTRSVCDISRGRISWLTQTEQPESASFTLRAEGRPERQDLSLAVRLEEDNGEKNAFTLEWTKDMKEGISTRLRFSQVECAKIAGGFEALGHPLNGWKIGDGMINGDVAVTWPLIEAPYATGKAEIRNLAFDHPGEKMSGRVPAAVLDLQMRRDGERLPSLEGKVEFIEDSTLAFYRKGEPFWQVDHLAGGLYFLPGRSVKVDMSGKCLHELCGFQLSLDGEAKLIDKKKASLDLAASLLSTGKEKAVVRFVAEQLGSKEHQAKLWVENVGPEEFAFVQEALTRCSPDWGIFQVRQGTLNAEGLASMIGWQLTDLDIRRIGVKGVEFDVPSLNLTAGIEEVTGDFTMHLLEEDPLKTVDAGFHVTDGRLISQTASGALCCLNGVKTDLKIQQGVVQKSEVCGEFAGLKGTIGVDWAARDKIVQLDLSGPAERLAGFLPARVHAQFLNAFGAEDLAVRAQVELLHERLTVAGLVKLSEQAVDFGFSLEKSSEKLWRSWPANSLAASFWHHAGAEVMKTVLPPIALPAVIYEANWIRAESGIAGMVLRNGWFKTENMDLARFVAPFLFSQDEMLLTGQASASGGFDQNILTVEYQARDVTLSNEMMELKVAEIGTADQAPASHYFDFKEGVHFGSFPMRHAVCTEKSTGLVFNPVATQVMMVGSKVHLAQMEAECRGILMAGDIDIDFGSLNAEKFDVEMRVRHLKGQLSHVLSLLSDLRPDLSLLTLPAEGQIALRDEGALFRFSFFPEDYSLEAVLKGTIREANVSAGSAGLSGLCLQFGYDHLNRRLEIDHLLADIEVEGQPSGYRLYGDHLTFDDLEGGEASFDFWVADQTRDLFRFVGKTEQELDGDNHPFIAVHVDHHLTHLGNIHPSSFLLKLKDWTMIDQFQLGMKIDAYALLNDLQAIIHPGVAPALQKFSKEILSVRHAAGILDVQLHYDRILNALIYRIDGADISVNQFSAQTLNLAGSSHPSAWIIDRLQWDEKCISGQFMPKEEGWQLEGVHFRNADIVALDLDGHLSLQSKELRARVHDVQIDLAQMSGTADIESFKQANDPHGKLIGYGDVHVEWGDGPSPWRLDAILDIALEKWDMKGIHFADAHNVSCHFISDQGLTMRKLHTEMLDQERSNVLARVEMEKIQLDFSSGEVLFDELAFAAPASGLPQFSAQLSQSFAGFVTPAMAELICSCKTEGVLKGVMQYELTPPYTAVRLVLEDGEYQFLNAQHRIAGFVLDYDPFEFSVTSRYLLAGKNVWLYARSSSPTLAHGELVLTDTSPAEINAHSPKEALYFDWENDSEMGVSFSHIEGSYQGLLVNLQKDPIQPPSKEALFLVGSVGIDGQKACDFFPQQMAEKFLAWQVGNGYELQGKWRFLKNHSENYGDKLHFAGVLKGSGFSFKGYRFDSLQAQMEYTPAAIRLNDFTVRDACGTLKSDRIDILKTDLGTWAFAMPLLTANQFRPCLLQEEGQSRPTLRKPMVVQELILEKTQGNLSDPRTMIGKGSFHFTNRSKKLLQNTIFQIPSDILSRIGLDPAVLTPVSGTVDYEIREGKIYLTCFRDIYSDAKLSKFYLAASPPSTVDFEGGLDIQVRMKQHNLIFKLAELFTFNIQGNLKKPQYSLQKQQNISYN